MDSTSSVRPGLSDAPLDDDHVVAESGLRELRITTDDLGNRSRVGAVLDQLDDGRAELGRDVDESSARAAITEVTSE